MNVKDFCTRYRKQASTTTCTSNFKTASLKIVANNRIFITFFKEEGL